MDLFGRIKIYGAGQRGEVIEMRNWMIVTAGGLALSACGAEPSVEETASEHPTELIAAWGEANEKCMGAAQMGKEDPESCNRAGELNEQLTGLGFCYGDEKAPRSDWQWQPCAEGSEKVDAGLDEKPQAKSAISYVAEHQWATNCSSRVTYSWDEKRGWLIFRDRVLIQDGLKPNFKFFYQPISDDMFDFSQEFSAYKSPEEYKLLPYDNYVQIVDSYRIKLIDEYRIEVVAIQSSVNENALNAIKQGNISFTPRSNPDFYTPKNSESLIYNRCDA